MRVKVQDHAMAEHTGRHGHDILHTQMHTFSHDSQNAATLNERLGPTRRTAVAYVSVGNFRRVRSSRLGGHHQIDGELLYVRGDNHLFADGFQFGDAIAIEHLADLDVV